MIRFEININSQGHVATVSQTPFTHMLQAHKFIYVLRWWLYAGLESCVYIHNTLKLQKLYEYTKQNNSLADNTVL